MIKIPSLLKYIANVPFNDADGRWHLRVPFLPRLTIDGYLIWLWPCWHRFVESTNWDGDNWYYEWSAKRPENT